MKTQTLREYIQKTEEEFENEFSENNQEGSTLDLYDFYEFVYEDIKSFLSTKLQQAGEVAVREERKKIFNTLEICQNHLYSKVDDKDISLVVRLLENLKEK